MIVKIGLKTYEINCRDSVTYEQYAACIKLAALESELTNVERSIITNAAAGPGADLRRLREQQRRLCERIARTQRAISPGAVDHRTDV